MSHEDALSALVARLPPTARLVQTGGKTSDLVPGSGATIVGTRNRSCVAPGPGRDLTLSEATVVGIFGFRRRCDRARPIKVGMLSTCRPIQESCECISIRRNVSSSSLTAPTYHATSKALGFDIDFKRLLGLFRGKGQLLRALYYTAVIEDQEFSSIRPLVDWLDYNGYTVVTKPLKEFTDASGRRKVKGNMEVALAVDAMRLADTLEHIVLFSGDGGFRCLVAALQEQGKRVSVVSTLETQPPMVADALRRQADQFIDLSEFESQLCRDTSRPTRSPDNQHRRVETEVDDVT